MSQRRSGVDDPIPARAGGRALAWPGPQLRARPATGKAAFDWRKSVTGMVALEEERRRWFNWIPVCMGLGVLAWFMADREPALWAPMLGWLICSVAAFFARTRLAAFRVLAALAAVFLGFSAAVWRTENIRAPVLERVQILPVSGFVESVEVRPAGSRLVLIVTSMDTIAADKRPTRIRITTPGKTVKPGDHISASARLLPPPEPARPGGYDFARDAFFRGIGAVGSVPGQIRLSPPPVAEPWDLRWQVGIDRARNALTERIANTIGGQAGAVAAALVTGKRGLITESTNDDLRAAGIYHVVSISGLHMVLAAGTIFWLIRAILALSQTVALQWPVKKIAAGGAMIGATAYCIFSGSEVATERSLVMTLVMLGAILVDRPALSMRNLAISAIIVLLREPETILGPSFQMSFGAVAALIAFAERWNARPVVEKRSPGGRLLRGIWLAAAGIVTTTLLATAATAPFGAYHFQTFNPFGLIGNAMALPFVSVVVMPAAVAGIIAYPFGLDGLAWSIMGWATVPVLAVARWVATFDRSTTVVPAFGTGALLLLALALVWATLWSSALRLLAIVPLVTGLTLAARPDRADIIIDREGAGALVRGTDGKLVLLGRPSRFVLNQWLVSDGDGRKPDDPALRQGAACDGDGCVVRLASGRSVAFSRSLQAVAEDCARADLVIAPLFWTGPCQARLMDRNALLQSGATSLRIAIDRPAADWPLTGTRSTQSQRLWSRQPPQAREVAPTPSALTPTRQVTTDTEDEPAQ